MSSYPNTPSSSQAPLTDEALMEEVQQRRATLSDEAYMSFCTLLCRSGRLTEGKLRALVWRDLVLGRDASTPIPLLGDGIIRQFQEETRSQATASIPTHSREGTNLDESFGSAFGLATPHLSDIADPTAGSERQPQSQRDGAHDTTASPLLPHPTRSLSGGSQCATAAAAAGPSTGLSASLTRRMRHRSVEPPSSPHSCPLSRKAVDRHTAAAAAAAAAPFSPVRRRAVSQISHRVKADVAQYGELMRAHPQKKVSSSNDLSDSILRPMAWYHLPENCQPRVVEADIERSLWKLYPKAEERGQRRRSLKNMILRVLLHNPERFYYQGLHELMGFVMYVLSPHLGSEEVVSVCNGLLTTRWRRFSARRLSNSEALLYAVHAVIAQEDPPLAAALEWCGVGPESHYAVSWVITWYVHSIETTHVLLRLFDYFVADPSGSAVVYFTAAVVMQQRSTIFEWIHAAKEEMGVDAGTPETTEDGVMLMARVYAQLSRLPGSVLPLMDDASLDALLSQADRLTLLYSRVVADEEANFLRGDVKKLGMLSNAATRNAALRLLWHFLPREWRNPARVERVRRFVFWTSIMVAATAMVVGTAAVDSKPAGWVRNLFH